MKTSLVTIFAAAGLALGIAVLPTPAGAQPCGHPAFGLPPCPFPILMPPPVYRPLPPPPGYLSGPPQLPINPEGRIIAGCVGQFGATYAGAGCAAGRLTTRELEKCANGVGTDSGCFGPNNDLRRHGQNAVNDLVHGPGPNNEVRKFGRAIGLPW
jgi:hypothetical protein